tara:strand:- start:14076 stop:14663 length:588 start_codon:yes stop_codon:yes gene_type:complete
MLNTIILLSLLHFLFLFKTDLPDQDTTSYLWTMDSQEEISDYGNDRTGAIFELNQNTVLIGNSSVEVIPSGSADDTKLSLPLRGERLDKWVGNDKMALNIYLPEENHVNPTHFFLGLADVTDGNWSWVHGTYWDEIELKDGWNSITYTLSDSMKELNKDGEYTIFIFFTAYLPPLEDNIKLPLHENFIIDGIKML